MQKPGHVVVCGVDDTALRTIEQLLAAGADVVVVDAVAEAGAVAERLLEQWDVRLVRGRLREALAEARLPEAAAVVCLAADDLAALEAALLVRRLRPEVRLVVRMANPQVGHALAEVVGEGCVLDVAALAAPSVVEICLGRRVHELTVAGREFLVADLVVDGAATVRELYGELAPLVIAAGEAPPVVCPSRDVPVRPGDRVTAVGTLAQFAHQGVAEVVEHLRPQGPVGARVPAQRAETGRAGMWALLRSLVAEADRPLRVAVILLGVVAVVSVLVLLAGLRQAGRDAHDARRRRVLHGGDDRDRRLRRLQLRRPADLAARLRDRPHGGRRRPRRHRLRDGHPAAGQQAHRAFVRPAAGGCDARPRRGGRPGHGGDRGRRGARRGGTAGGRDRPGRGGAPLRQGAGARRARRGGRRHRDRRPRRGQPRGRHRRWPC